MGELIQINDEFPSLVPIGAKGAGLMSTPINPGYHYCKNAKRNVSLEQSEGQCRERHNCADGPCPLESEFREGRFSRALALLLPGFNHDPDS